MISFNQIISFLDRFFFHEEAALGLGIFRIIFGLVILTYSYLVFKDSQIIFGAEGLIPEKFFEKYLRPFYLNPLFKSKFLNINVRKVIILNMLAAVFYTLGLQTTLSSIVLFLTFSFMYARNPFAQGGPEQFMRILCFLSIFAPCSAALSLQQWLRSGNLGLYSQMVAWPLQLMRLQLVIIIFHTVLWKLRSEEWRKGKAVYWILKDENVTSVFKIPSFFAQKAIYKALNYGTLAIQASFPFLLEVRETRVVALSSLAILHGGLQIFLNVGLYQPLMLASIFLFIRF